MAFKSKNKILINKFLKSAIDFVFFTDEKLLSVAVAANTQNDNECIICTEMPE